jgi:hypothetical protein
MHMRNRALLRLAATAGLALAVGSTALAGLNGANHAQWDEDGGSGSTPPPGQAEFQGTGFFGSWDTYGRVISNASVTTNAVDSTALTTINTKLWQGSDADLFQIKITNPATFSASIPSTTSILALFQADGTAVAASRGGAANAITGANSTIPGAGIYYIGEAVAGGFPKNQALQNLFDFTTDGVKAPIAQADQKLSTDPYNAWTLPGGSSGSLLGNSNFTTSGSTITLAGADFAQVPEPASAAMLMLAGAALAARRRLA